MSEPYMPSRGTIETIQKIADKQGDVSCAVSDKSAAGDYRATFVYMQQGAKAADAMIGIGAGAVTRDEAKQAIKIVTDMPAPQAGSVQIGCVPAPKPR